jgi:hypothetical protein
MGFQDLPGNILIRILEISNYDMDVCKKMFLLNRTTRVLATQGDFAMHVAKRLITCTDTNHTPDRRPPWAIEYELDWIDRSSRELNVHRIVEIVMRGTSASASDTRSRFASLRDAIIRVARDATNDAHASMLVRAPFFMRVSTSTDARATPQIKKAARDLVDLMRPSIEHAIRGGVRHPTVRMTPHGIMYRLGTNDTGDEGPATPWVLPSTSTTGGVGRSVIATMDELVASIGCGRIESADELLSAVAEEAETCYLPQYGPISFWDVSSVRSMMGAFDCHDCTADLYWATHHVGSMERAFANGTFAGKIGHLDVSSVVSMSDAFANNHVFDQPLDWDVSRCERMDRMFMEAHSFNQDLSSWNVSRVCDMSDMFRNAKLFNKPLATWDVRSVQEFVRMFDGALSFNQPLDAWRAPTITGGIGMYRMFHNTPSFTQPLRQWILDPVETRFMFHGSAFDGPIGAPGDGIHGRRLLDGVVIRADTPVAPDRSDDEINADPLEFSQWHDRNTVSFIRAPRSRIGHEYL